MKKAAALILTVTVLLFNTGCRNNSLKKFEGYTFDYFDTVTTVVGYANSKAEFDEVFGEIKKEIEMYHKLFDIYNTYEDTVNIADINALYGGKHKIQKVDKKVIDFILFSKDMYTKTMGKTNIAMGSVLSIWHKYREEGNKNPESAKLPDISELKSAAEHTDIENITVDEKNCTVFLADDKMLLDVGAVAKGYTAEKICEFIKLKNLSGYIVNLGGNVKAVGTHPNGEKFSVGIENPNTDDTEKPFIEQLYLNNTALVTSGSYQRYYTVNGKNYNHIINPDTLFPGENFLSVSVISENSGLADALSTALFSMSFEKGLALVNSLPNTEALWVLKNENIEYSANFKDFCF